MVYEDLDAGDETRRNGDYVNFPHPYDEDTALADLSGPDTGPDRGAVVGYDPADDQIVEVTDFTGSGVDIAGVVADLNVSGKTGMEVISGEATVKMRGEVVADLSGADATVGAFLDDDGVLYVEEDLGDGLYRVQVR